MPVFSLTRPAAPAQIPAERAQARHRATGEAARCAWAGVAVCHRAGKQVPAAARPAGAFLQMGAATQGPVVAVAQPVAAAPDAAQQGSGARQAVARWATAAGHRRQRVAVGTAVARWDAARLTAVRMEIVLRGMADPLYWTLQGTGQNQPVFSGPAPDRTGGPGDRTCRSRSPGPLPALWGHVPRPAGRARRAPSAGRSARSGQAGGPAGHAGR